MTLGANIGVLAGIIFLALEMQQNTDALQAEFRQAALDSSSDYLFRVVEDPELWLMRVKPTLSDSERTKLSAFLFVMIQRGETAWRQYQAGAIDEESWRSIRDIVVGNFSYLQSKIWWDYWYSRGQFEAEFGDEINRLLQHEPIRTESSEVEAFN